MKYLLHICYTIKFSQKSYYKIDFEFRGDCHEQIENLRNKCSNFLVQNAKIWGCKKFTVWGNLTFSGAVLELVRCKDDLRMCVVMFMNNL